MIKEYSLECKEDEETGDIGLCINNFVATSGRTLAHDILEHIDSNNLGTINNEMRALGVAYYIRHETGHLEYGAYSSTHPFVNDLRSMIQECYQYESYGLFVDNDIDYSAIINDELYEFFIYEIKNQAIKDAIVDIRYDHEEELFDRLVEFKQFINQFMEICCYEFQVGYELALETYDKEWDNWDIYDIFSNIEKSFKGIELFEGAEYLLTVNFNDKLVSLEDFEEDLREDEE